MLAIMAELAYDPEQFGRPLQTDREVPTSPRTGHVISTITLIHIIGQTLMPQTPHIERHFTGSETVRDIVIGMSDGLTVPFALAAGLSGAIKTTSLIVTAGLAEIAAGSIAMGLGGYLAAKSDAEHY